VTAGLVTGLFSLAALLSRPLSGWLLDLRSRRSILLLGTFFCLLVIAMHALVGSITVLVLLRVLHGVGFAVATTASGTLASDLVPRRRLGQGLGYLAVSMGLPMAISPAVGIWLAARGQFGVLFGLAALLTAVSLVLAAGLKAPGRQAPAGRASRGLRRSLITHLFERRALLPSTLIFLLVCATGVITALLALYGEERGIASVGMFFTVYALVLSLMRSIAGGAADRWGYQLLAGVGLAFAVAGVLLIALAARLEVLLLAAVLYAVGFGTAQPSLQAMALRSVPAARRGAATASFYTAFDLGMGVGSLAAGFLAGALVSMSAVFALSAGLPFLALLLLAGQYLRTQRTT
jgi:MFS family permease